MTRDQKLKELKRWKRWYQTIDLGDGIVTKGDPGNNQFKWRIIRDYLLLDMSGSRVADFGSAEGYFTLKVLARGCREVDCWERDPKTVERAKFALDCIYNHQPPEVRFWGGDINDNLSDMWFEGIAPNPNYVIALAILHWIRCPIAFLEMLGDYTKKKAFVEIIVADDKNVIRINTKKKAGKKYLKWVFGKKIFEALAIQSGFPSAECIGDYVTSFGSHRAIYELAK